MGREPVRVALYGMDPRSYKTMEHYLKGPCKGIAVVVDAAEAEVDIIDADFATAGEILEARRQQTPLRPIVLLSLQPLKIENTLFVQKPVNAEALSGVLSTVRATNTPRPIPLPQTIEDVGQGNESQPPAPDPVPTNIAPVSKQRAALLGNEGGFTAFLGTLIDIDFNDHDQLFNADFDPKRYFLGYVQSAYKVAVHKGQTLQLNSIWKPLLICPDNHQVWLDADDKQLRVFAGIEQNRMFGGNIGLVPVDADEVRANRAPEKFQDMEAFIWKLAIWTSKGRFPHGLSLDHPVFLKQWPNFTRLMITPDALRIAALLTQGPRTPLEIIRILNVNPQYVFVFISACHSLGLLGRSERRVDETIVSEPPKASKKKGLLAKILSKLRGD